MPRDLSPTAAADAATSAAARDAAERDRDGAFPASAFAALGDLGLTAAPPLRCEEIARLLGLLAAVGRGDLSVGRIFEGHCNALLLIALFGSPEQREEVRRLAEGGALFGTWNTDHPEAPVRVEDGRLVGAKNFASGAGGLTHAIVTAATEAGRIMVLVTLEGHPVDRSWWHPMGMHASCSHVVDVSGAPVTEQTRIGAPDDYIRAPWLQAGAIRFAAVQAGGMHALLDIATAHLRRTGRLDQPYQQHRLAHMAMAVQSAYGWLDVAGEAWRQGARPESTPEAAARAVTLAHGARMTVEQEALALMERVERSVGAAGMIAPHPMERVLRDMRTYLRQPNPDGALTEFGRAVGEGAWTPLLPGTRP